MLRAPTQALKHVNLAGHVNLGRYLAQSKINGKPNDVSGGWSRQLGAHIEKIIKVKIKERIIELILFKTCDSTLMVR